MARWVPETDKPIGSNEHLGRRLFDEPLLAGAEDQKPFAGLHFSHFEEKRDGKVSLDRLGQSSIDRKVLNYLRPLANCFAASFQPPKQFNGWSVIRAYILSHPPRGEAVSVIPSPETGPEHMANIYHAHVVPGSMDSYIMALHLRQLFADYGNVKPAMTSIPDTKEAS
jgi:hypothetical protein